MSEQWLNYQQLAQLWAMSPEAARTRARRGRYQRRVGNDGQAEVLVDTAAPVRKPRPPRAGGQSRTAATLPAPAIESPSPATAEALVAIAALEGHIASLKDQIAKADAQADELRQDRDTIRKERDAERERVADLTAQLLKLTADLLDARKAEAAPQRRSWWARLVG